MFSICGLDSRKIDCNGAPGIRCTSSSDTFFRELLHAWQGWTFRTMEVYRLRTPLQGTMTLVTCQGQHGTRTCLLAIVASLDLKAVPRYTAEAARSPPRESPATLLPVRSLRLASRCSVGVQNPLTWPGTRACFVASYSYLQE